MRIIDQPLPAQDGAGLFKIDAHDDLHAVLQLLAQRQQVARVIHRRHRIVNRARPDDHQQPAILAVEDVLHRVPSGNNRLGHRRGEREGL